MNIKHNVYYFFSEKTRKTLNELKNGKYKFKQTLEK